MKHAGAIVVFLAVVFAANLYWLKPRQNPVWLGWIEADIRYIGGSRTARLTEKSVEEGDKIQAGQMLFSFASDIEKVAVSAARAKFNRSEAALSLAKSAQDRKEQRDALKATREEAEAELIYAEQSLKRARFLYKKQAGTRATLDKAIKAYAQAKAARNKINVRIKLGELPQRDQQIEQAKQEVVVAKAELASAQAALALKTVVAPTTGLIEETYYRVGEVVPAGRPVVSLLTPETIRVEFFIPEAERARVKIGDTIKVTCDGCRAQNARISFIAQDAEYTPPQIFSREERSKMVYRAKAIPQTTYGLPVGLPVSVETGDEGRE